MNKRAVSIMVGYVMLVVIAVGLSAAVYTYLKLFVPKEKPECTNDISLIIQDASCTQGLTSEGNERVTLDIILKNRGLFSVQAAYIRMAPENREVRDWINPDTESNGNDLNFYFTEDKTTGLAPGDSWTPKTSLATEEIEISPTKQYTLEIQPAEWDNEWGPIACKNAIITQDITCA